MKTDRRAVRDIRKNMSFSEYDLERVNKFLEQAGGGERATFMYECFKRGLDLVESQTRRRREQDKNCA